MRGGASDQRSIAPVVLVIVIAWALAAVLMLTGTLMNARKINDRVHVINRQVVPINRDLDAIRLAARTDRIAARIAVAAAPLSGQLNQVIRTAAGIDGTARLILGRAQSINGTARSINGHVHSIGRSVDRIHASVGSIGGSVGRIHGNVDSIGGHVGAINQSVHRIEHDARQALVVGRSIDSGVATTNRGASRVIVLLSALKSDFAAILAQVGTGHGDSRQAAIHGHANSIDCSRLLNSLGRTRYCDR